MLCALATTQGLSLTAAGRDRRVPLRAGPPLDGVDLAFGGEFWICGFSSRPGSVLGHRATVRPSLICHELNQCGRGWGGDGEICLDLYIAHGFAGCEFGAVICYAPAKRAHSGSQDLLAASPAHERGAVRCDAPAKRAHSGSRDLLAASPAHERGAVRRNAPAKRAHSGRV